MTRVESLGSIWMLDDDSGRYARMPKTEGPRVSPEGEDWGGPGAGVLEDLKWHPMKSWKIEERPVESLNIPLYITAGIEEYNTLYVRRWLAISVPGDQVVNAPDAVVVS